MPRSRALLALSVVACAASALACCLPDSLLPGGSSSAPADPLAAGFASVAELFPEDEVCDTRYSGRAWCPVAHTAEGGWTKPDSARTLLGLHVDIPEGGDRDPFVLKATSPVALHLRPDGVRLTALAPRDDDEKRALGFVVMTASAALSGNGTSIPVTPALESFLSDELDKTPYTVTLAAGPGAFEGVDPGRIWRVTGEPWGTAWVVVEVPRGGGVGVSVFPEVPVVVGEADIRTTMGESKRDPSEVSPSARPGSRQDHAIKKRTR